MRYIMCEVIGLDILEALYANSSVYWIRRYNIREIFGASEVDVYLDWVSCREKAQVRMRSTNVRQIYRNTQRILHNLLRCSDRVHFTQFSRNLHPILNCIPMNHLRQISIIYLTDNSTYTILFYIGLINPSIPSTGTIYLYIKSVVVHVLYP